MIQEAGEKNAATKQANLVVVTLVHCQQCLETKIAVESHEVQLGPQDNLQTKETAKKKKNT